MGIGTEPAWYGTGEVKFSKHIMLRSGSDYTLLDKLMTKRAADDAKAPNGIMAESAGAYEWTDTRVSGIENDALHADTYKIHDGTTAGGMNSTREDSRYGKPNETFNSAGLPATNWNARPGVEFSFLTYEKQGDGSWICISEWKLSSEYKSEYQAGRLSRMQSCADGLMLSSMNMKVKYAMLRGADNADVIALEKWWDRNGFGHLKRNDVWNEDVFSTNQEGTIPVAYPAGHPLAT